MDKKKFDIKANVIKETFDDKRQILSSISAEELDLNEKIHHGGDFFITSDGEFIDLEFQQEDFTEAELAKYVELAEELYEISGKAVSVYLICPREINVDVREFDIKSNSTFNIKLACIPKDSCEVILNGIKAKIKANEMLDENDLEALAMLPEKCKKEEKRYYLSEYFKIMNRLHY